MDSNLMSCPTCGHSVNNTAGACAYCGAMMAEEEQQPQIDEKEVVEKAQVAESPPLEEIPPADITSDEAGETPLAATGQSESNVSQPLADSPAAAETSEPAMEAETVSPNESVSLEEEIESKHPDDEQDLESKPKSGKLTQDVEGDSEIAPTEAVGPESVPDADAESAAEVKQGIQEPEGETAPAVDNTSPIAQNEVKTESATDEIPPPPEPEVVDTAGDETGESETLGENIIELVEIEAPQHESETQSTLEKPPPLKKIVEEAETKPVEELQPKNEADIPIDAEEGSISESLDDTILLEVDNEVETAAGVLPDKIEETAISESQAEAMKIENAAQDMAAAMEEPKAALTKAPALTKQKAAQAKAQALKQQKAAQAKAQALKQQKAAQAKAQALKQQKAALAKTQALKQQKLVLANAAALNRKKAVQAKAQALKKQKAAQAAIEAAKKGDKAAARTATAADRPKIDRSLQADTTMQTLLEKFKGQAIGINYDNSAEIREAQLVEANAEYFSVFVKDKDLHYSYPLKSILTVIEGKDGVNTGNSTHPIKFSAVIKVYPLVLF